MKVKKLVGVLGTLALLSLLVMPMAVLADTTDVGGTVAATPVVTSLSPAAGDPGQTATSTTITGSDFEDTGDTVVTMEGPGLVITNSLYVNSTTITFDLAIAAGATATAGTRDVTVTQAGQSGTGTDEFTVNLVTSISAPAGFNIGYMDPTASPATGTSGEGSVTTNAESWTVTALESTNSDLNVGKMTIGTNGSAPLTSKFQISKTAIDSGLENADAPGLSYVNSDGLTLKVYCSQAIAAIDSDIAGTYTITITYTCTAD